MADLKQIQEDNYTVSNAFTVNSIIQKSEPGTQVINVRGSSSLSDVAGSTQSQKWNDIPWAHSQQKLFWGEPGGGIQGLMLASMCANSKFPSQIDKYFRNSVPSLSAGHCFLKEFIYFIYFCVLVCVRSEV